MLVNGENEGRCLGLLNDAMCGSEARLKGNGKETTRGGNQLESLSISTLIAKAGQYYLQRWGFLHSFDKLNTLFLFRSS